MKKIYQTRFGGIDSPIEEQGNCLQACIASILEIPLEEAFDCTPYEYHNSGKVALWFREFSKWLAERNLACIAFDLPKDKPFPISKLLGYHIAECKSKTLIRGESHVVVMKDGEFIHDPNPNAKGIGKMLGFYLFVPLDPTKMVYR